MTAINIAPPPIPPYVHALQPPATQNTNLPSHLLVATQQRHTQTSHQGANSISFPALVRSKQGNQYMPSPAVLKGVWLP